MQMRFLIYDSSGKLVNTIVSTEKFAKNYCSANGYTYKESSIPIPEPEPPTPAQLREEAYNTQAVIPWDGSMITVTQASQKWQYYAAEGNTAKTDALTALIAEAKASIREQYPDT